MLCPTCGDEMICQTETTPPTTPVFAPFCVTCYLGHQTWIRIQKQRSVEFQMKSLMGSLYKEPK